MLTEKDYLSAPEDPIAAFFFLEKKVRSKVPTSASSYNSRYKIVNELSKKDKISVLNYINSVRFLSEKFGVNIFFDSRFDYDYIVSASPHDIDNVLSNLYGKIDSMHGTLSIRKAHQDSNKFFIDESEIAKIMGYLEAIRKVIVDSDLHEAQKQRFFRLIEDFVRELNGARVPYRSFYELFTGFCDAVRDQTPKLEPAVALMERVGALLGRGNKSDRKALPNSHEPKKLEGPRSE